MKKFLALLALAILPLSAMAHGPSPVSYTHLDVYKRQGRDRPRLCQNANKLHLK